VSLWNVSLALLLTALALILRRFSKDPKIQFWSTYASGSWR
jgi:hypothetical protein